MPAVPSRSTFSPIGLLARALPARRPRATAPRRGSTGEAWPRPAGTFERVLEDLVAELETQGVHYAFLAGQRQFPRVPEGGAIELLVEPAGAARLERALEAACARRGASLWQRDRAGHRRRLFAYAYEGPERHAFLEVGVHTALCVDGVPILTAGRLLAARSADSPRCLPSELAALTDFLLPFAEGRLERRRMVRLANVLEGRPRRLHQVLGELLGLRRAAAFVRRLRAEDHAGLAEDSRALRRALVRRAALRRPIEAGLAVLRSGLGRHLRPLLRPRGLFVTVIGSPGAGKSALIDDLATRLAPVFREGGVHRFERRPGWLRGGAARPGALIEALDWLIGHALRVLPLQNRGALVLFEGSFDDRLVPAASRPRPRHLEFLARRVPRPAAVLVCTAEATTIRARRPERFGGDIVRDVAGYERLQAERSGEGYHLVRTEGRRATTLDQALRALFADGAR